MYGGKYEYIFPNDMQGRYNSGNVLCDFPKLTINLYRTWYVYV